MPRDKDNQEQQRRRYTTSGASDDVVSRVRRNPDDYSAVMRSLRRSTNPLAAFCAKPYKTNFATQDPEEKVLLILRKHPVTQVPWILFVIVGIIMPSFIDPGAFLDFLPIKLQIASTIAWYMAVLIFGIESFLSWYYNVNIITDERVIDIDFTSLMFRNVTSAQLGKVEDVTSTAYGFMGTVFDYGDIRIQTAGAEVDIVFDLVPKPTLVARLLNELLQEEELEQLEGRIA